VGLFYRSPGGIVLLDRGLTTRFIGLPVENYVPATAVVKRGIHYPAKRQVQFVVDDSGTERILIFDYSENKWSVKARADTSDITLFNRVPHRSLGTTVYADSTGYEDPTEQNGMVMETGWFKLNQLEGFGGLYRIYLTGNFVSSSGLRVTVRYDYREVQSSSDIYTWAGSDLAVSNDTVVIRPRIRKCKAFKLLIEETSETAAFTGTGIILSGMSVEYGLRPRAHRHYTRGLQK